MEKFANLLKALEMCAGPDCCEDRCPYYNENKGGKTCRAWLLTDANVALNNERALRESAEEGLRNAVEELGKLHADVDDLEAANNTIRAERDSLRLELDAMKTGKTDRKSVYCDMAEDVGKLVAHANYQQGRADTLAAIVERCSFGGGGRHE